LDVSIVRDFAFFTLSNGLSGRSDASLHPDVRTCLPRANAADVYYSVLLFVCGRFIIDYLTVNLCVCCSYLPCACFLGCCACCYCRSPPVARAHVLLLAPATRARMRLLMLPPTHAMLLGMHAGTASAALISRVC
jgi:hypothetical protein